MIKNRTSKQIVELLRGLSKKKLFIALLYLLFSLLILRGVLLSHGRIIGNDWGGLPTTISDITNTFHEYLFSWSNSGNALGTLNFAQNSLITMSLMKFFSFFGVNGILFVKMFLVFVFALSGYSMYTLLRYFKLQNTVSFLGGILYITTPLFFNYTIMGWTYVLLFMAMLPFGVLYFIKAHVENSLKNIIIVAFIFEIMLLQSQAIVWFPLTLLALSIYLVSNKKTFMVYIKNLALLFLLTLLLNLWWGLTTIFVKSPAIFSSDILMSSESLGASIMLVPLNIIRLYGSLFNNQFEYVIKSHGLSILSFLIPMLVVYSFFLKDKIRLRVTFFTLSIVPLLFYFLNFRRDLLSSIPLINIVRDFGRFAVLSTFAITIIAAIAINYFYKNKRSLFYVILVLFFIFMFPWYGNYLTKYEAGLAEHQRIRTEEFPQSYSDVYSFLNEQKIDSKGIFLPASVIVELSDDPRFNGDFQGFYDTFFSYSKFHGWYPSNSRNNGLGDYFTKVLLDINNSESYKNFLKLTDVSNIIIRTNMVYNDKDKVLTALSNDANLIKEYSSDKIIAYLTKTENFLPHIYTPVNTIVSDKSIGDIPGLVSSPAYNIRSVIFLQNQNLGKASELKTLPTTTEKPPTLEFNKINLTKYRVVVHNATEKFPLVFSESFHDGWKLYNVKYESHISGSDSKLASYKILDGNEADQATKDELTSFINQGLVSNLGNGTEQTINHQMLEGNTEKFSFSEKYTVDFISKNFQGTIQNDNLPAGKIWETWFARKPGSSNNGRVIQLPDENHLVANGYANSWTVDPNSVCSNNSNCIKNADGTYDFELVVDFWPQRLFYLGLLISGSILLGCVAYLVLFWRKNKRLKNVEKNN